MDRDSDKFVEVVPCAKDATTSADKANDLDRLVSHQRIEMRPHDLDQIGRKRVASLRPVESEFGNSRLYTKHDDVAAIRLHLSVAR